MAIKKGDRVKYKGDEPQYHYVAAEDQVEGRNTIKIVCVNSGLPYPPINTVPLSMIEEG